MSAQSIRPSQFITTYGPGAIIEGRNGPRLIPLPDIGLFNNPFLEVEEFEISDSRLTKGILGEKSKVFRLPSNAELDKNEDVPVYRTKSFPGWNLCINSNHHTNGGAENVYILYKSSLKKCPVCGEGSGLNQQAVRFVLACPRGHLDDFDWYYFVHNLDESCRNNDWFEWVEKGSSLNDIYLRCPVCGKESKSLEKAYKATWPCHGRYPEREGLENSKEYEKRRGCGSRAKIIQRQASYLRIPEIISLFAIPPRDTALHRMLDNDAVKSRIVMYEFSNMNEFESSLRNLEEFKLITREMVNSILSYDWEEIKQAIADIKRSISSFPSTYQKLIDEELRELLRASKHGSPPEPRKKTASALLFEVNRNKIRRFTDSQGKTLIVTPISTLLETIVQMSYRREIRVGDSQGNNSVKPVPVSFERKGYNWYPGIELKGEGIFISTPNGYLPEPHGHRAGEWYRAYESPDKYNSAFFRDESHRIELHPLFVYLHTLSHSVIRSVSMVSGYSSTALRERVYLNVDAETPRGGFLIYATQPGNDGTSGGLISLADSFDKIYHSAINSLKHCSNDPLCIEDRFSANGNKTSGSSCYGCTLISETSCEHRNMWLDRGLVLDNPDLMLGEMP